MSDIYARCLASQQTIAKGDLCRVMALSQSATFESLELSREGKAWSRFGLANTVVHADCYWKPNSAFILAKYDDYGFTDLVLTSPLERAKVATFFGDLVRQAAVTQAGKNPCHDLGFDFQGFTQTNAPQLFEVFSPLTWMSPPLLNFDERVDDELRKCWHYLSDLARRHRVFVHSSCGEPRPLQLTMLHEQAYQALTRETAQRKDWEGVSLEMGAYLEHAVAQALTSADDCVNSTRQEGDTAQDMQAMRRLAFGDHIRAAFGRYDPSGCLADCVSRCVTDRLARKLADGAIDSEEFIRKVTPLQTDRMVLLAMECLEVKFAPVTFVREDLQNTLGRKLSGFINEVSLSVSKERAALQE